MEMSKYLIDRHASDLFQTVFGALDGEPDITAEDAAEVAGDVEEAFIKAISRIYGRNTADCVS